MGKEGEGHFHVSIMHFHFTMDEDDEAIKMMWCGVVFVWMQMLLCFGDGVGRLFKSRVGGMEWSPRMTD